MGLGDGVLVKWSVWY